ncbi:n-acyl-d-amino-acid deacylase : Penicillin-binding protein, beta-lactamase class C OS=Singulisphaera acidiphila (strain ATCC BAA-1392 / DSM 18658 / VKM B-2454 / MOB10) GN=Sinac_4395 PE=4 SV=1: Beta-lactamase [Gemmataceae bacterium]|nr:n-acyl-d-amino-acid deacylase : Penicillin-binding protein, beta-lactamase class C OS=Singulisphaera acidiphila (strain ATCC BAA-1392 / DSM 18658 / VKM B-2454 / MOB10) GN=Sinac_4395 PE=4 SV=1: Beta-lactamase [Gemmataceae bacterium]VTU00128.1 n-acyl-d-amino-acid deacylase : Penicillin-binding protein, beta-lactamase class C OS=Singulisphaera acidiphila (strain ATCC BAA-1392 / DSM 18658 / VKM B-2454 / MOB10) GN=Sinac_4395 PE=4 SV=1: Beta-lactamase [Gemmataceae bacterium]
MPTRREFLASSAALAFPRVAPAADVAVTGAADPALAPFDDLFTTFLKEHTVPGAGVAVARNGKLIYARGFGLANVEAKQPVEPTSAFRIASVSKPITAVGVLRLVDAGKVKLDDRVMKHLKFEVPAGGQFDKRWNDVTVRHCLHHTGGWDRGKKGGFDPIGTPWKIMDALGLTRAPTPDDVVRYMLGKPLDFEPGEKMVYSNLGYLVLGRVIEAVTGQKYEPWVRANVLKPVGAAAMHLGRGLPEDRPKSEVRYYDSKKRTAECLYPPRVRETVPLPDGGQNVESFEAHGGWVASPVDLLRFACAFDHGKKSPVLSESAVTEMWARPDGPAGRDAEEKPQDAYYGCGWMVRPVGKAGRVTAWHNGLISGTSTLLVRRSDGLNWAVLFNTDATAKGEQPASLIDGPMHAAAAAVKTWPDTDLFEKY